jgi:hypothetical protein
VLTNMLLPYALTQMTNGGMPSAAGKHLEPDAVAPVLTALASQDCRLNGECIVRGGGRLRRASVVEWGTVPLPDDPDLGPEQLAGLLAESGRGEPREFRVSVDAFTDLIVAVLMLATFGYAMRTGVHAIMDTVWPLGFVVIALVSFGLSAGNGDTGGGCWCLCSPVCGGCGWAGTFCAQLRAGRGQAVRVAAAAQPGRPGHLRAALHLLGAGPGDVWFVSLPVQVAMYSHAPLSGVAGRGRGGVGGGVRADPGHAGRILDSGLSVHRVPELLRRRRGVVRALAAGLLALARAAFGDRAGLHDQHAGQAHQQEAAREAHGALPGHRVRRLRPAHQRVRALAAAAAASADVWADGVDGAGGVGGAEGAGR